MMKDEIPDSDPIQCIDNEDVVSLEQEELQQATSRDDMRMRDKSGETWSDSSALQEPQGTDHADAANNRHTSAVHLPPDITGKHGEQKSPVSQKHAVNTSSSKYDHSNPPPTPKSTSSLQHETFKLPDAPVSVKRRRLATNTLTSPFKTPLKTPSQRFSTTPQKLQTPSHHPNQPSVFPSSIVKPTSLTSSFSTSTTTSDSPLALEASIARTQADIAALIQARDLLLASADANSHTLAATPDHTAKLTSLTTLWLSAARRAAEALFEDAERRVENMGGVKAWRKSEACASEGKSSWGWDEDEEQRTRRRAAGRAEEEEEEVGAAEMEERKKELAETEAAAEVVARQRQEQEEDEGNALTMEMMLRSLSIDPDVMGWDAREQKWVN